MITINSAVIFGPLMIVAGIGVGVFYDAAAVGGGQAQARGFWLMAVLALVGCLAALPVLKRAQPQSAGVGG